MTTNPILEVTSTSPPPDSSVKRMNRQGSDRNDGFDKFLTREIDRTHPQKQGVRSSYKPTGRQASSGVREEKYSQTTPTSRSTTYAEENRRTSSEDTPATQSPEQTNTQDRTNLAAAAAASVNTPAVQAEASKPSAEEMSETAFQASVEALTKVKQNGEPPPEQALGPGVVVEQPPPQTEPSEPARLAEAQSKTKLPNDQIDPHTISVEEFKNLLRLQQAGEKAAQTLVADQQEQAAATLDASQTVAQTGKATAASSEQVAGTTGQSSSQAQAFLRSLQQYGQVKEVTFSQTMNSQGISAVAGEKASATPVGQANPGELTAANPAGQIDAGDLTAANQAGLVDASDLTTSNQAGATPIKPTPPQTSAQNAQPVVAELSTSKQAEQSGAETSTNQENSTTQGQSQPAVESGLESRFTQKSGNTLFQSGMDAIQTPPAATETSASQMKAAQAKIESASLRAAENAAASKASSSTALQAQGEGKKASEGDAITTDGSRVGDKTPPAAILNTGTSEATQQSSETRTVHRVLQQTFNHLDNMTQSGQKTLRVQLYPENLGHLELRLTSQGGSLQVVILADSSVTQQALQQNARDLQQSLQQSGVNLSGLTVGHHGDQEQPSQESHGTYQQMNNSTSHGSTEGEVEEANSVVTDRLTYLNPYTSMEYRV